MPKTRTKKKSKKVRRLHFQNTSGTSLCGDGKLITTNRMKFNCRSCRKLLLYMEFHDFHRRGAKVTAQLAVKRINND
jgi:hypothetical protein